MQQKRKISTYLKNVHHLEAGSFMSVSPDGDLSAQRYWSLNEHLHHENRQFEADEAVRQYRELIADSTTKRLMSDVPVGLYLSGGIDSSLLAAIAARSEKNLHCFTVVENTTVSSGDAPQAVKVTGALGIPLYAAHFDVNEFAENFTLRDFERMIVMIESPRFNPEWLFKCELHRFAKQQVPGLKVVLLGQGADEFAGGYSNREGTHFENWNDYLAREVSAEVRSQFSQEQGIPVDLSELINLNHFDRNLDSRSMDYHEKMLLLVSQMQHFNLWHEDRSSSFYGLEARVPFLDHRLVEFLAGFPDHSLERMFWDKSVVREVLALTLEDYPKDRKKVPFIATEDYSTIDSMVLLMAMNLYPAFRMLYLEMDDNPLFRATGLDEIHDSVKNRDDESIESAWRMMAMMSVAVFEKFCRNPKVFLDFVEDDQGPVCRRLTQDELDRLDELYPDEAAGARQWTLSSTVRIPDRVRLLSGLDANEQDTDLFLHRNDQVAKTLTIPHRDAWVVNLLERLANHQGGPSDIEYWSNEMKVTPQNLCEALDYLVGEGFLEKTA
jgi:asparagine synthase (glutamine-hydrolysing)